MSELLYNLPSRKKAIPFCIERDGLFFHFVLKTSTRGISKKRSYRAGRHPGGHGDVLAPLPDALDVVGVDGVPVVHLARDLDRQKLASMTRTIKLDEVIEAGRDILDGKVRGRIVVEIA